MAKKDNKKTGRARKKTTQKECKVSSRPILPQEEPRGAGQPTKYKPEYCEQIIAFFDVPPWETMKIKELDENGGTISELDTGKRQYTRMPTIEGFAKSISVCITTVYNWVNEKHDSYQKEFLYAYNKAKGYRKNWLIDVGLSGLAPANSFKFVAVNCTDMTDKQDVNHSGGINVIIDK